MNKNNKKQQLKRKETNMKLQIEITNYKGEMLLKCDIESEYRDALFAAWEGFPAFKKSNWKIVNQESSTEVMPNWFIDSQDWMLLVIPRNSTLEAYECEESDADQESSKPKGKLILSCNHQGHRYQVKFKFTNADHGTAAVFSMVIATSLGAPNMLTSELFLPYSEWTYCHVLTAIDWSQETQNQFYELQERGRGVYAKPPLIIKNY